MSAEETTEQRSRGLAGTFIEERHTHMQRQRKRQRWRATQAAQALLDEGMNLELLVAVRKILRHRASDRETHRQRQREREKQKEQDRDEPFQ
jgi:hypothetical protein